MISIIVPSNSPIKIGIIIFSPHTIKILNLILEQQFCFETPLSKPLVSQAGGFPFGPTVSLLFTQLLDFSITYPPSHFGLITLPIINWGTVKAFDK
jgi:hypothetical protein